MVDIKPNSTTALLDLSISLIALLSHSMNYGTEDNIARSSITLSIPSPPQQHRMSAGFQENREALMALLRCRVLGIDKPPGLTQFSKQGLFISHTRLDKHARPQSHCTHKHTRSQTKHTSVRLATQSAEHETEHAAH